MKKTLATLAISVLVLAGFAAPATAAQDPHTKIGDCWIDEIEAICDGVDLTGLKNLTGVSYVSVNAKFGDISVIESMPDLDRMWVWHSDMDYGKQPVFSAEMLDSIVKTDLSELTIRQPVSNLTPLSTMSKLKTLNVHSSNYSNGGASLVSLTDLETLRVSGPPSTDLSAWGKSNSLKELEFTLIAKQTTAKVGTEFTFPTFTWLDGQPFPFKSSWDYSAKQIGTNKFKALLPYYVWFMDEQAGSFRTAANTVNWRVHAGDASVLLTTDNMGWNGTPKLAISARSSLGVTQNSKTVPINTELYLSGEMKYPRSGKLSCHWFKNGKSTGNKSCKYLLRATDSKTNLELRVAQTPTTETSQYLAPSTNVFKANYTVWNEFNHRAKTSGTTKVGSTLKATSSNAPKGTTYSYQWLRDGKTIRSATKSTYKLTAADLSKRISVNVTAKKSGYYNATITTARSSKISKGTFSVKKHPTVSGSTKVGKTLKSKPGTWSVTPDRYTYQWYRSGAAIKKATKSTYKMTSRDKGKVMYVKVSAHKAGYTSKHANSKVK